MTALPWIKPKPWNGKDLKGTWLVTYKIDGVQARFTDEHGWQSRAGKPLYNLPAFGNFYDGNIFEVFNGVDWDTTVGLVRRSKNGSPVPAKFLYQLWPALDGRLQGPPMMESPTAAIIDGYMQGAISTGYEGLVLVNTETGERLKVKPKETYDVKVTGIIEGTGKHRGRMGALMTDKGKVGTGFSDDERKEWWKRQLLIARGGYIEPGDLLMRPFIIEVDCMGITKAGKFRHPRFIRERFDKSNNEESA